MSFIADLVTFLQGQWGIFVGIFGLSLGLVKFWLRDAEVEIIRLRFMSLWDYLDNAKRYNLHQIRAHRRARVFLLTTGIILYVIPLNLYLISSEGIIPTDNVVSIFIVMSVSLIPPYLGYLTISNRVQNYINMALRQKYTFDTLARLILPPILIGLYNNDHIISLYSMAASYLLAIAFVLTTLMVVYYPSKLTLYILERVFLRIAELKDGPVYFVAFCLGFVGFGVKVYLE